MKKIAPYFLLPMLLLWSVVSHAQSYRTLNMNGFNADVIANGIGQAINSTNNDMDGVAYCLVSRDYQLSANSTHLTYGLPVNGLIQSEETTTPGLSFQLQSYDANNAIRLTSGSTLVPSTILSAQKASRLFILATSASGFATLGIVVMFEGGDFETSMVVLPDWFGGTTPPVAVRGLGRINRKISALEPPVDNPRNPRLHQIAVDISPANQTKKISSIQFNHVSGIGIITVFGASIELPESCPSPPSVTIDNITTNSAKFTFNDPNPIPAQGYNFEIRSYGAPGSGISGLNHSGVAPNSITSYAGLPSGQTFYFYVRSRCDTQNTGNWRGPFTFTTLCGIQGAFYENFDDQEVGLQSTVFLPTCWGKIEDFPGKIYITNEASYSGRYSLRLKNTSQKAGNLMVVAPRTDSLGNGGYRIRFRAKALYSPNPTTLKVVTLENPDNTVGMQLLDEVTLTTSFKEYIVNIPSGEADYFGLAHGLKDNNQEIYIDDVRFEPIPTCFVPTDFAVSSVGLTSAILTWQAPSSLNGETYELEIRTSGAVGSGGTGLPFTVYVNSIASSVTLPNLLTGTQYTAYIKTRCSASDTSYWSDGVTFTPNWCKPTYQFESPNYRIPSVSIAQLGFMDIIPSYTNRDRTQITIPDFYTGNTYTFNVTMMGYTAMGIAIDFNKDGRFNQSNEILALPDYIDNITQTYTAAVTIPQGIAPGEYRMRIWNRSKAAGGINNGVDPCGIYDAGTWADYTVNIRGCASQLTLSTTNVTLCSNTSSEVVMPQGAASFDTFTWQPATGVSGNATQGWVFNPTESTTYQLTASNSTGMGCTVTIPVIVSINTPPPPPIADDQTFCEREEKHVQDLVVIGDNIKWYADETVTIPLPPSTLLATRTYYATQTVGGCESSRAAVRVMIENPVINSKDLTAKFEYGTSSDSILNSLRYFVGTDPLIWHEEDKEGTSIIMPNFSTLLVGRYEYWLSKIRSGCESSRVKISVIVKPRPILITPMLKSKNYGAPDPELTYTISEGIDASVLRGSLFREPGESIGTYEIRQGSLSASSNYILNFSVGTLSISPVPLTVTANAQTKVEGTVDPILTYQVSRLQHNDQVEDVLTGNLARDAGEIVGTYPITQGALDLASSNYTLDYRPANLEITATTVTVKANAQTKVYGEADPILTYTVSGLPNNVQPGDIFTGNLSRDSGENAGIYAITQGTLHVPVGYRIEFEGEDFTITPAELTVTTEAKTKVFGDTDPVLTYTVSELPYNDQVEDILTGDIARDAGESVGIYPITQGTLDLISTNYTLVFEPAHLEITSKVVTVKANTQTKVYGEADPILTYTVLGLPNNVQPVDIFMGSLSRDTGENTGTYTITQGSLSLPAGYTLEFEGENLTITPATLTVNAEAKTKVYGDVDPALTYTVLGLQYSDKEGEILTGSLIRDAGETAGDYAITQGSLTSNANYTVAYHASDLTITPTDLVIIADPQWKDYGEVDPQWTFTFGGLVNDEQIHDVVTGTLVRLPGENIGVYTINQGSLVSNGNYNIQYAAADLTIVPAELTVTANPQSKVYGAADPALTYTVLGLQYNEQEVDVVTGNLNRDAGEDIGTYAIIKGSLTATTNYTINYVGGDLVITPTVLTVTANSQSKVYGATDPELTYTVLGLQHSDQTADVLTGVLSRDAGDSIGTYAITQGNLVATANYMLNYVGDSLKITPTILTVTANPQAKVYGSTDPELTYTVLGLQHSDQTADVLTGVLSRDAGEAIGDYAITQGSLTATANYTLSYVGDDLVITPAVLTVTANPQTKVYGAADPELTYTVTGLQYSDQAADVLTGVLSRDAGEAIGDYAITQGSLTATANYTLSYVGDDLVITPAVLTVTANPQTKVYGAADPELTYTVTGLQYSDQAADVLTGVLSRDAGEAIGDYAITQGGLIATANYTLSYVGDSLKITPTILTVTANPQTKVYGAADPTLTYTVTGLQNSDQATDVLTGVLSRNAGETIGTYAITQGGLTATANYTLSYVGDDLVITPAVLTVTANPQTKVYGAADPTLTYTVLGLQNSDQATDVLTGVLSRDAGETIGTYAITQGGLIATANYTINYVGDSLKITPAVLTVTANSQTKVYGAADPTLTYTVLGLQLSDQATDVLTGVLSRDAGEVIGDYAITQGGLIATANYTLNYVGDSLKIIPAVLTVTANPQTKVYGATDPTLTYTVTGLQYSDQAADVLTGVLSRDAGEAIGDYAITQGSLTATANYTINYVGDSLKITPAVLTVTVNPQTKRYGTVDPVLTYTVAGLQHNEEARDVLIGNLSRNAGENVGVYTITQGILVATANYTINYVGNNLTITPAVLTVTANPQTKVYGAADATLTYTVSGLEYQDEATDVLTGALSRDAGENVGIYDIRQGTLVSTANYTIEYKGNTLTITPAELTIQLLAGQQKQYGQVDPVLQFTAIGLKNNEAVNTVLLGLLGRQAGEQVGAYNYMLGSLHTIHGNYNLTLVGQEQFEILPAPLHIVVNVNQSKRYGQVDPILTYTVQGLQRGDFPLGVLIGNLERALGEDVGMYLITQGTLATRSNYIIQSFAGATFEIKKAVITGLTLPSKSFVYDGQEKQLTVEGSLIEGVTIQYSNNNQTQVGSYTVTANISYGSNYEPLRLQGVLTITQAEQIIVFDAIKPVVLEDTPSLQLEATASSGLAISYTIDNPEESEIAVVDASGTVRFLQPGFVTITARQEGNANYKAAVPVHQTIEVTSRDASIWDLKIDGVSYGKIEQEVELILGCESQKNQLVLEVFTQLGAVVSPSNYIVLDVTAYGNYEQEIHVQSANGKETMTYVIRIDKRIPTENIVYQKYDNVLLVNNNKQTNGGYVFSAYEWFKNGESLGHKQFYSAGNSASTTLDTNGDYHVELTLYNGKKIRSCPIVIQSKTTSSLTVYPNPVEKNKILHIKAGNEHQETMEYAIYNIKGQLIKRGQVERNNQGIEIPSTVASGSYYLVLKIAGKQQGVQFIVQ